MPTTVELIPFRGEKTWAQVTTPDVPDEGALPLVVLHGGPGMPHDYLNNLGALADDGRTVIHYDQLGCGLSTHLPDAAQDFWNPQLFVDEFTAVVETLGLERYHVIGHSWGGMLACEIALTRPDGLESITLMSTPASMELWVRGANSLRRRLPADVQATLQRHEDAGTIESSAYEEAVGVFYSRHVCRMDPFPADFLATLEGNAADPTVYLTMNGPNEFYVTGTIRDWSVVDRLAEIKVPTLIVAGEHDEATPIVWAPFTEFIPDVRVHLEPDASHLSNLEHPDAIRAVISNHLCRVEQSF